MRHIMMAGLAAALASPAWAQGNVTLHGTVDVGVVVRSGNDGAVTGIDRRVDVADGAGAGGSRFGFRGGEDLGHGLSAFFDIEWGFGGDSGVGASPPGANSLQARHAYVGLAGPWGVGLIGRVNGARATVTKDFDPFQGAGVASYGSNALGISRANNALAYITPSWKGFNLLAAYTNGAIGDELPGNVGDTRIYALIPAYTNGPFTIKYDHEEVWTAKSALPRLKVDVLAASYDLGYVKLFAILDKVKSSTVAAGPLDDLNGALLGFTAPVSAAGVVKASWVRRDRKNLNDRCDQYGVGYQHNLSKRSWLYADFAQINNKDQGSCQIGLRNEDGAIDVGPGAGPAGGYGTRGLAMGIVHKF